MRLFLMREQGPFTPFPEKVHSLADSHRLYKALGEYQSTKQ